MNTHNHIKHTMIAKLLAVALFCSSAQAEIESSISLPLNQQGQNKWDGVTNTANGCTLKPCLVESGLIFGAIDGISTDPHIHHMNSLASPNDADGNPIDNPVITYHYDSPTIYLRASDNTAFSLDSFHMYAPIAESGTINREINGKKQTAFWEVVGFNQAYVDPFKNPDQTTFYWGNNTNVGIISSLTSPPPNRHPNQVAYQVIPNGFVGTVVLNDGFRNVKSVWLHYGNYLKVPQSEPPRSIMYMELDDIAVSPSQTICP